MWAEAVEPASWEVLAARYLEATGDYPGLIDRVRGTALVDAVVVRARAESSALAQTSAIRAQLLDLLAKVRSVQADDLVRGPAGCCLVENGASAGHRELLRVIQAAAQVEAANSRSAARAESFCAMSAALQGLSREIEREDALIAQFRSRL